MRAFGAEFERSGRAQAPPCGSETTRPQAADVGRKFPDRRFAEECGATVAAMRSDDSGQRHVDGLFDLDLLQEFGVKIGTDQLP